jgi:hypothetical protein
MFKPQDKRSFAVKKWLLQQGYKEEEISSSFFREQRRVYYSNNNSPWGRAKSKSKEHFEKAKANHINSMDRSKWQNYINPFSKQYYIQYGYSHEEAEHLVKARNKFCKEYWKEKGYSNAEYIAKKFNPGSYEYYVDKPIERTELINANNPTYIDFWLNRGYTYEEALTEISYYKPYCDNFWLSRGYSMDDIANIRSHNLHKSILAQHTYSQISQNLFESLPDYLTKEAYFGKNEYAVFLQENEIKLSGQKAFKPDFMYKNKVIEFFGDYYHANPRLYMAEDVIPLKRGYTRAIDIWEKDADRITILENYGYVVFVVWEYDYIRDSNRIRQDCIKFLEN